MAHPILFDPVDSPYLAPFDDSFKLRKFRADPDANPGKDANTEALGEAVGKLSKLQERLYAHHRYSVLLIFQAMDAAGKDGTIRAVMTGINPQGCQVYAFKPPNAEELDHDFLWRSQRDLPERGRIGIWNRSHYEEVLVVRVNPAYLDGEKLPRRPAKLDDLWIERYESIVAAEKHWARNGCVVLKFFLNVSQNEQHKRFLERVTDPEHFWKFNSADMAESKKWDQYMEAYQDAISATSKPWAPWYVIPADSKHYMRRAVAEIIVGTLKQLDVEYPKLSERELAELARVKQELEAE
ncbi:MAG TPA: PPK2 family polyphosphate kinase [Kofleriaceae bacterium]|nr:PPK2 family polyphosphate kinase [Kofleriaceae bacterium]